MELVLYHRQYCPYSKKVRDFIDKNKLNSQIEYRDIEDNNEAMERLVKLTGGQQVPCLVIDGRPKLESENIVKWLDENVNPGKRPEAGV